MVLWVCVSFFPPCAGEWIFPSASLHAAPGAFGSEPWSVCPRVHRAWWPNDSTLWRPPGRIPFTFFCSQNRRGKANWTHYIFEVCVHSVGHSYYTAIPVSSGKVLRTCTYLNLCKRLWFIIDEGWEGQVIVDNWISFVLLLTHALTHSLFIHICGVQVALTARVEWLATEYLAHHQPGDTLPKEIQLFKGCMRESEVRVSHIVVTLPIMCKALSSNTLTLLSLLALSLLPS